MRKLILWMSMTLDVLIERANGEMDGILSPLRLSMGPK